MKTVTERIAAELTLEPRSVAAAVGLLDGGATVPFIARYRKEATGQLDDVQLRALEERLRYLRELDARRDVIIGSIADQGKLDPQLERELQAADTKGRLEDIYLPYKPKRRTKAQIAIEAGLAPLADALLFKPDLEPADQAASFIAAEKGVETIQHALDGARSIVVERLAENASLIGDLRERVWSAGRLVSKVREGKQTSGARFADYFDWSEPFSKMPSHRILALFRGEKEDILDLAFESEPEGATKPRGEPSAYEQAIAIVCGACARGRPGDKWIFDAVRWAWRTRISVNLALDIRMRLWQRAEDEAVKVFASSLRAVLLAAPAGSRPDSGTRSGVQNRRQGRGGRRDRQSRRNKRHLSARASATLGRGPGHPGSFVRRASCRACSRRQRHGLARDGSPCRRFAPAPPRIEVDQGHGLRGRRLRLFGFGLCV